MTKTQNFLFITAIILAVVFASGSFLYISIMRDDDARLGLKASLNDLGFNFNLAKELKPKPPNISPTPSRPKKYSYTEPEIGMDFTAFSNLCLQSNKYTSEDGWRTYESRRGTIDTIRRGYSTNRDKNKCWGTFTFVDGELESISRY